MPRNGTKNLIPVTKRTKEEAKEISRKGGIASGKARNFKKDLRACIESVMYDTKLNQQGINQLKRKGIQVSDDEQLNLMMGMAMGLSAEAMKGSASAGQTLMDMMGIPRTNTEDVSHELTIKMADAKKDDLKKYGD